MDADPIFVDEGDIEAARELVESTEQAELSLYAGDQHYFADSTLPSYDADAAELLLERTLAFLRSVDAPLAAERCPSGYLRQRRPRRDDAA